MGAPVRSGHLRFWRLKLLAFAALAGLLAAVAGALDGMLWGQRMRTEAARFGAVQARFDGRAVIARDEQVVAAPSPGRVTLLAGEGRHVRTGEPLVELEADEGAARRELEALERRAAALEAELRERRTELERERRQLEGGLEEAGRRLREALAAGASEAAAEAEQARAEYERLLGQVDARLGEVEAERIARLAELQRAREELLRAPPAGSLVVRAPVSGYLSFALDGFEGTLFPGAPLEAAQAVLAAGRVQVARAFDGFLATQGTPLLRIAASDRAEAVLEVRGPVPLPEGSQVRIAFASIPERTFRASVAQVVTVNQTSWVRLALREFDASLVHLRLDRAAITAQEVQGVVVPASSLIEVDGRLGVYILVGESAHFRRVKLLGGDGSHAVIEGIDGVPLGAPVVVNPAAAMAHRR